MKLTLDKPKEIVLKERQTKIINEITIMRMVELPKEKKVLIFTKELGQIVLWEGEDYDLVGQWTDDDVKNRLLELYS